MCRISQFIRIPDNSEWIDLEGVQIRVAGLAVLDAVPMHCELAIGDTDQLITRINVPSASRGKGYGRIMLKAACDVADLTHTPLWLECRAYITDIGLNQQQLKNWYERNGFKTHQSGYMLRMPA